MKEEIQFRNNSPYGDYCNGTYVMATLPSLKYVGDDD